MVVWLTWRTARVFFKFVIIILVVWLTWLIAWGRQCMMWPLASCISWGRCRIPGCRGRTGGWGPRCCTWSTCDSSRGRPAAHHHGRSARSPLGYTKHVSTFRFFNVFITRQAPLCPNVLKQENFRDSLQKSPANKLNNVQIFSSAPWQNYSKFCGKVFMPKVFKT